MCESNIFVRENGKEVLFFENVGFIKPDGEKLIVSDLFGNQKTINGTIIEVDLLNHKILIEKR